MPTTSGKSWLYMNTVLLLRVFCGTSTHLIRLVRIHERNVLLRLRYSLKQKRREGVCLIVIYIPFYYMWRRLDIVTSDAFIVCPIVWSGAGKETCQLCS